MDLIVRQTKCLSIERMPKNGKESVMGSSIGGNEIQKRREAKKHAGRRGNMRNETRMRTERE